MTRRSKEVCAPTVVLWQIRGATVENCWQTWDHGCAPISSIIIIVELRVLVKMQYINHLRIVAIGVKLGLYQKYYDEELKSREMKDEG